MKELLTKKFWQDVKRTFDEARAETPNNEHSPPVSPSEENTKGSQTSKDPGPPAAPYSPAGTIPAPEQQHTD